MRLKKLLTVIPLSVIVSIHAICPLCTVTIGAGVGLSRWLAIDDLITGIWAGGLIASLTLWIWHWLQDKSKTTQWITGLVYGASIAFLFWTLDTQSGALIGGIKRLWFGMALGGWAFLTGIWIHYEIKTHRNGRQLFAFQKVIIPVALITIVTLIALLIP